MLRIVMFVTALLVIPATASQVDASCNQGFEVAAARGRWAVTRRGAVDPAHYAESCRAFGNQFFEAVSARQATAICEDGTDRRRTLEILDSEIEAFNNLIAAQCGGS